MFSILSRIETALEGVKKNPFWSIAALNMKSEGGVSLLSVTILPFV